MQLHPDEAYYWEWSRYPDWSYYDQGPGVAFYIKFFTLIFGDTFFALKFAALFGGAVSFYFLYLSSLELGFSKLKSFLILMITMLLPGYFGGVLFIMHDTPLILNWSLAFYSTIRFMRRRETAALYSIFFFLAMGTLAKHTMVFFALSLVLWFLLNPSEWKLLRNRHLYLAAAMAAALVSPIIIWNMQHNWDGVSAIIHLRSSGGVTVSGSKTGEYLAGQAGAFSPFWLLLFMIVPSIYGIALLFKKFNILPAFYNRFEQPKTFYTKREFSFVLMNGLILPVFFLVLSSKRMVQANWVFGSYPAMVMILVHFLPEWENRFFQMIRRPLPLLVFLGLFPALFIDAAVMYSVELARYLPHKFDMSLIPGYRIRGFKEVIDRVSVMQKQIDPSAVIVANRYQDAAIASFYLPGRPRSFSMNILQRNQYSYWPSLEKDKNYIVFYISENTDEKSNAIFEPVLSYMFEEVKAFPEEDILAGGVAVKRFQVWHCKKFKRHWDMLLVDYMTEQAILDLMPNIQGRESRRVGSASTKEQIQVILQSYDQRKGKRNCNNLKGIAPCE